MVETLLQAHSIEPNDLDLPFVEELETKPESVVIKVD